MQDEVNEKTVALSFRAARLTKETLMKAIQMYLRHRQGKKMRNVVQKHGKIPLKALVGQGQGASSIDIGEDNIKAFERIARKYDVDFAVKKDKTMNPPKYVVFFKAKDQDAITDVIRAYSEKKIMKAEKQSVLEKLHKLKEKVASVPRKTIHRAKEKVR